MSDENKPDVPDGLSDYTKKRSVGFVEKLRRAMETIESEIEHNEGLYPYNAGRPTKNELCRRAGVNASTLQNPVHKNTTNLMVDEWLARLKSGITTGKKVVRKAVTERADTWKALHEKIGNQYALAELELVDVRHKLRDAEKEIQTLKKENAELREKVMRLSGKNIVPLAKKES